VNVVRIVIWNLSDSKTSIGELREHLPAACEEVVWIANEPQERFGLVSRADELPDLSFLRSLIGKDPEIGEEFDVLD
jgi:hypothetical protein